MNPLRLLSIAPVMLALSLVPAPAGAQRTTGLDRLAAAAGLSGSLRLGHWSSTRSLDATNPEFSTLARLKSHRTLGSAVSFQLDGWGALRGPADSADLTADLREAYVDVRVGHLDVRAGRQVVAWGRADGINPTDNITPHDYTLLVPDDADRRVGTTGVRATAYAGGLSLSALWFPEFRPDRLPLPAAPDGIAFRERAERWPNTTWGLRLERTGGAVDWSVSMLRGVDPRPDLSVRNPGGTPSIDLSHHQLHVIGIDAATNVGHVGMRGEIAFVDTEDDYGYDAGVKNGYMFAVVGGDRTFGEHLNLNLQFLWREVNSLHGIVSQTPFEVAVERRSAVLNSQVTHVQQGLTSRVRYAWLNDLLEAELASVLWFGPRGQALSPKVSYAITDHLKVVAGGESYRGESTSTFGLMRRNSVAFAELRLAF